jgi:hypothetical protein
MKMSDTKASILIATAILLAVAAIALALAWVQAHNESRVYNKLTGANTTTWDAMWVELRVQDAPR